MDKKAKIIAFYLPQFHPIPENDSAWGKNFTEWTNVTKAKPLFRRHYQPHIPKDLGYYDLRKPEIRDAQAELAKEYGIEAFCYYHYWFAGKQLLEKPFNEVLKSGKPDFPFCLCWANHSWTGIWCGCPDKTLIEQTYPGMEDHTKHFDFFMKAFRDKRYLTIEKKPVLVIYRQEEIPHIKEVTKLWRELAVKNGLPGLYLIYMRMSKQSCYINPKEIGFDAYITQNLPLDGRIPWNYPIRKIVSFVKKQKLTIYTYKEALNFLTNDNKSNSEYPCIIPNWDNTSRCGTNGLVFHGSTPKLFKILLKDALEKIADKPSEYKLIFLKSWNEWAEGNHIEPDLKFGKSYLRVIKDEILY